jgi:hypothetical protein
MELVSRTDRKRGFRLIRRFRGLMAMLPE